MIGFTLFAVFVLLMLAGVPIGVVDPHRSRLVRLAGVVENREVAVAGAVFVSWRLVWFGQSASFVAIIRSRTLRVSRWMRGSLRRKSLRGGF